MFNRQKALIHLIRKSGGEITRLVLTKLAFLLRHETESCGGDSFYDFVPYHYGPFSFGLYQEAEKLVSQGYLHECDGSWRVGEVEAPKVEQRLAHDIEIVSKRFAKTDVNQMLDYVYKKYPNFTVNSKRKQLAKRKLAPLAVYTAGYEGKSIDSFLNGLVEAGIMHLIDVRMNPIARRYGFHRSTLSRLCDHLGIKYTHVPALGIPSELRQNLETENDYDSLFSAYEATTLKKEISAISLVSKWTEESPSVLVCMESDSKCCHRGRLAKLVSRKTGLPIIHLM